MGLNLALHTGDVKSCVMMNRSIVTQCCPSEPKWLTQVHGTTVLCADDIDSAQSAPEADAQWTSTSGVVACVMTADCLPVFIADRTAALLLLCTLAGAALPTAFCREPLKKSAATVPI